MAAAPFRVELPAGTSTLPPWLMLVFASTVMPPTLSTSSCRKGVYRLQLAVMLLPSMVFRLVRIAWLPWLSTLAASGTVPPPPSVAIPRLPGMSRVAPWPALPPEPGSETSSAV